MNYGGFVADLTAYNGQLVAGGEFWMAGSVTCNGLASWNGSSWQTLGSEMAGGSDWGPFLTSLTVYNEQLVAGGDFTAAGGVGCNYIASWNGSSWQPLGSGMAGGGVFGPAVIALTVYNGQLVAGGYFTTAGGVGCNYIASWNGSSWQPLSSGVYTESNCSVNVLTVYNGQLVAGANFTTAGGVACNYIACWDGSSWQPLGSGMSNQVNDLTVCNGQLVAGGNFTTAGGVACNYIASWNGSSWQPLGGGMGGGSSYPVGPYVGSLVVYNGQLVAGGNFTRAGGLACNYIARWCLTGDSNCDGHVNLNDLLASATSWGKRSGYTGFRLSCDFNGDGVVNVIDLLLLADNWGK